EDLLKRRRAAEATGISVDPTTALACGRLAEELASIDEDRRGAITTHARRCPSIADSIFSPRNAPAQPPECPAQVGAGRVHVWTIRVVHELYLRQGHPPIVAQGMGSCHAR